MSPTPEKTERSIMSITNLRIVLVRLTRAKADVRITSDEVTGAISFKWVAERIADGWQSTGEFPDNLLWTIALSLYGPERKGPVVELPVYGGMAITLARFVPGDNRQEILGTVQVTNPDYESAPAQLCCRDGQVCQVNGLTPGEHKAICQALADLRATHGGLPLKVVTDLPVPA
jgi:hypothetical protein